MFNPKKTNFPDRETVEKRYVQLQLQELNSFPFRSAKNNLRFDAHLFVFLLILVQLEREVFLEVSNGGLRGTADVLALEAAQGVAGALEANVNLLVAAMLVLITTAPRASLSLPTTIFFTSCAAQRVT